VHIAELSDRKAQNIEAQRRAVASDRLAGYSTQFRLLGAGLRNPSVIEQRGLDRRDAPAGYDAKRPQHGDAQFRVPHRHPASEKSVEDGAPSRRTHATLIGMEGAGTIAPNQGRIA
jgi:hypothetical protein